MSLYGGSISRTKIECFWLWNTVSLWGSMDMEHVYINIFLVSAWMQNKHVSGVMYCSLKVKWLFPWWAILWPSFCRKHQCTGVLKINIMAQLSIKTISLQHGFGIPVSQKCQKNILVRLLLEQYFASEAKAYHPWILNCHYLLPNLRHTPLNIKWSLLTT